MKQSLSSPVIRLLLKKIYALCGWKRVGDYGLMGGSADSIVFQGV